VPQFGAHKDYANISHVPLGMLELGLTLGFLGGFIWVVTKFLSQVPVLTVSDPLMNPHPDDVHVHSMDHH
jgi:flagellar biogenesis protein FliO